MTTAHTAFQFIGGDDWEIRATCVDENDAPYNLATATVKWTLYDSAGVRIIDEGDYTLSIVDAAAGILTIWIPAEMTTTIAGGRYSDALRITTGGVTSTLSMGQVFVIADPWRVVTPAVLRLVAS